MEYGNYYENDEFVDQSINEFHGMEFMDIEIIGERSDDMCD
jgi:hypothetical protein